MNRRKFLLGIGASLGAAYGLKAGRFGALARKASKRTVTVPVTKIKFPRLESPDRPLRYFLHPSEWARIAASGYDMHDCILIEPIPGATDV